MTEQEEHTLALQITVILLTLFVMAATAIVKQPNWFQGEPQAIETQHDQR